MSVVGRVQSVWRYPVKSMRGEELEEACVGFGGLRGDRVYAIHSASAPQDFPYFTARNQGKLLLYRPYHREGSETDLTIEAFGGETFDVTDPRLLASAVDGLPDRFQLRLLKSDMRFRANLYVDLADGQGFGENGFVGRTLRIGPDVLLAAAERDVRCKMITLDPDTFEPNPQLMKVVTRRHEGCAGIYADVLEEGMIRPGDQIKVLD